MIWQKCGFLLVSTPGGKDAKIRNVSSRYIISRFEFFFGEFNNLKSTAEDFMYDSKLIINSWSESFRGEILLEMASRNTKIKPSY